MYNIHNHYDNIAAYLRTITDEFALAYLIPFGSTKFENIERIFNGHNGPIVLCYDQEPLLYSYNKDLFDKFFQNKVHQRPVILLNTEKVSDEKNLVLKRYNFIDSYYFFHIFAAADWYRSYQFNYSIKPIKDREITKLYITFNRITGSARIYRAIFVAELLKNSLFNKGYISFNFICPEHGSTLLNLDLSVDSYNLDYDYVQEIKTFVPTKNLRIESDLEIPNGSSYIGAIDETMQSFCQVVTETCYWENKTHLTEKIFKPVVCKQPFLLLGCVGNLEYFKSYGFKTFDRWWDESYDNIQDPIARIQAVVLILKELSKLTNEQLKEMLVDMEEVLEYNYNLFYSKEFLQQGWQELKTNLKLGFAQL
jgi:hypothetical protein